MAARKAPAPDSRAGRLLAVRDRLAEAIAECDSKRDLAALVGRYQSVLAELDSLAPVQEKETRGVDEISRRRAARRGAAASDSGDAASGTQ
jgi:hypothetical protein